MSGQRSGVLELAVLGILHETPMHGYELRKRLNSLLGAFRAFGYGSLYPALKDMLSKGLVTQDAIPDAGKALDRPRRSKIVYRLTAEGKERLNDLLGQSGPASWEDDGFGVHFAFFGLTQADIRLRILEGPAQPARGAARGVPGSRDSDAGASRQLHARTATPWPGVSRTRSPLAE